MPRSGPRLQRPRHPPHEPRDPGAVRAREPLQGRHGPGGALCGRDHAVHDLLLSRVPFGLQHGVPLPQGLRPRCHDVHHGLAQCCNVFFYQVGIRLEIERISRYARLLGLGEPTGVDLPHEAAGLVPARSGSAASSARTGSRRDRVGGHRAGPGHRDAVADGPRRGPGRKRGPPRAPAPRARGGGWPVPLTSPVALGLRPEVLAVVRDGMWAVVTSTEPRGAPRWPGWTCAARPARPRWWPMRAWPGGAPSHAMLPHGWFICFAPQGQAPDRRGRDGGARGVAAAKPRSPSPGRSSSSSSTSSAPMARGDPWLSCARKAIDRRLVFNIDWVLLGSVLLLAAIGVAMLSATHTRARSGAAPEADLRRRPRPPGARDRGFPGLPPPRRPGRPVLPGRPGGPRGRAPVVASRGGHPPLVRAGAPGQLQPSEFVKLAAALFVAKVFSESPAGEPGADGDWRPGVAVGVLAVLIAAEPDLGTAFCWCRCS